MRVQYTEGMGEEPESLLVADFSHSRRLFRLIFTVSARLLMRYDPAQVRFTEYDHVVEAVPSPNLADR
jgi:hypothetical protein